ncbi:MAG: hypothetical protein QXT86_10480 [Archaeoglobaceae archaeon]
MVAKKKKAKKITPETYNAYLTGNASAFGSYCPLYSDPKDEYFSKVKQKLKNNLTKVDY